MNYTPSKTVSESLTVMTEMVLPNDTNSLGNLMGGNLLKWMDVVGAICARRHANAICVTAGVDHVSFLNPIRLNEVVTLTAQVTRVFNSSMEIRLLVFAEGLDAKKSRKCNEAYLTFVCLDEFGHTQSLPKLQVRGEEEQKLYDSALRRREMRLILAGKMKPKDSENLRQLFVPVTSN